MSRIDVARQVQLHLESLKSAGVEFIPILPPLTFEPLAPAPQPEALLPSEPATPSGPAAGSPAFRRHELALLAAEIAPCDRCSELFATRTQTVFGVGPVDPEICFVGEAPGADEDASGEPFVGRAGQLLNKIIVACGFQREEVYICNTLKCRPPNNRTPTVEETRNCRDYFDRQIALVRPKYLVALGGVAAKHLLNTSTGITKLRGKLYDYQGIPLLCTFHPSALLRDDTGARKRDTWEDMKMLLKAMGRPVPGAKS